MRIVLHRWNIPTAPIQSAAPPVGSLNYAGTIVITMHAGHRIVPGSFSTSSSQRARASNSRRRKASCPRRRPKPAIWRLAATPVCTCRSRTCVPSESNGAAKGKRDLWGLNDAAQKNADKFEGLSGSPFQPIEFDFSVHNGAPTPEHAYIEPDGLPYGMTLMVSPSRQQIAAGATAIFHCTLTLDEGDRAKAGAGIGSANMTAGCVYRGNRPFGANSGG